MNRFGSSDSTLKALRPILGHDTKDTCKQLPENNEESFEPCDENLGVVEESVIIATKIGYCGILPLRRTLLFDEVDMHRDDSCAYYDDCLLLAIRRDWASFSCLLCEQTYREPEDLSWE